jgi:hypothetical protein
VISCSSILFFSQLYKSAMPKVSSRWQDRREHFGAVPTARSAFLATPGCPRMVSFEDGTVGATTCTLETTCAVEASSSSFTAVPQEERQGSMLSLVSIQEEQSVSTPPRLLSTLSRRPTSICLVELLQADSNSDTDDYLSSSCTSAQTSGSGSSSSSSSSASPLFFGSVPLTPVPQQQKMQLRQASGQDSSCDSPSASPSPWGQFVDMVIPANGDEDYQHPVQAQAAQGGRIVSSTSRSLHVSPPRGDPHGPRCKCCASCRRRRAGPYGDSSSYKNKKPLLVVSTTTCLLWQHRPLTFSKHNSQQQQYEDAGRGIQQSRDKDPARRAVLPEPTEDQLTRAIGRMRVEH